jgi:type IV secretory pathway TraG/TraD family ATPase VirD4
MEPEKHQIILNDTHRPIEKHHNTYARDAAMLKKFVLAWPRFTGNLITFKESNGATPQPLRNTNCGGMQEHP